MADVGIVKGRVIGKNRDGDKNRVILQVEMLEDDVRTIELFAQHGEDVNPADGCRVVIDDIVDSYEVAIAISDDLEPDVDPGEKEIYSTDSPVTSKLARIKFDKNGNIILNSGTNNSIQAEALQVAINTFLVALNGQLTGLGAPGGLTLDITPAKVTTVKVP